MMNDYQALKKQAEDLRKEKRFDEALPLYEQLWRSETEPEDKWIGWGYVLSLRKVGRSAEALEVCREVYRLDPTFDRIKDQYGWCIYDQGIKQPEDTFNEAEFFRAAEAIAKLTTQADYSPYEKAILQVVRFLEAKRKGLEDAKSPEVNQDRQTRHLNEQIIGWLDRLDPTLLSLEPGKKSDGSTYVSPREDWYNSRAKALVQLNRFKECIEVSQVALAEVERPHYDYDIWFRWYMAKSHIGLKEYGNAIPLLEYILQRKHDAWIRVEYVLCLDHEGRLGEAVSQAAQIAQPPKGLGFRWKVFLDLGLLLERHGNPEMAAKHILLAAAIRAKEGWTRVPPELAAALQHFGLSTDNLPDAKRLHRDLTPFWKELSRPQTSHTGTILRIHPNGKSGHIRGDDGNVYFFGMRNVDSDVQVAEGVKVGFNLSEQTNSKSGQLEMHAVDILGRT